MAWDAGPDYVDLIAGAHEITTTASAWYGGQKTADLEVDPVGGHRVDVFDGRDVRRTIESLTVLDPDGALAPRTVSDPLAPFGQRIMVRQKISAAGGRVVADYPLGEYLITNPTPTAGWRKYHHTHLPTGGVVTLTALDRWEIVQKSPLIGLWQPPAGATIRSEIRRLVRGIMPVVDSFVPSTAIPTSKAVHPEDAADAIRALLQRADRVPHVDRAGRFAPLPRTHGLDPWRLSMGEQSDVGALPALTDDGIYNRVVATGESDDLDAELLAIADERGRLAPGPQFGWRTYKYHSPVLKTQAAVNTAANTRLANLVGERTIVYKVRTMFDPARDVLDPVELTIIPNTPGAAELVLSGQVTRLQHSLTGGQMDVEVSIPWTEAGTNE